MIRISEKEAPMRLDQLMADHQYARKDIKQLLARRQILVDHLPAQKLSQNIDPGLQQIQIGERIIQEPRHHYYMLHKPIGAVTAKRDAHHPTVIPSKSTQTSIRLVASIATPVVCSSSQIMVP